MGWDEPKIAASLGITRPTLRKHYFSQLKVRDEARARLEARMIVEQVAKAASGDTQAYREVRRAIEKAELAEAEGVYRAEAPRAKGPRLGKKEERQQAADEVGGMFAPGPPPAKLLSH